MALLSVLPTPRFSLTFPCSCQAQLLSQGWDVLLLNQFQNSNITVYVLTRCLSVWPMGADQHPTHLCCQNLRGGGERMLFPRGGWYRWTCHQVQLWAKWSPGKDHSRTGPRPISEEPWGQEVLLSYKQWYLVMRFSPSATFPWWLRW